MPYGRDSESVGDGSDVVLTAHLLARDDDVASTASKKLTRFAKLDFLFCVCSFGRACQDSVAYASRGWRTIASFVERHRRNLVEVFDDAKDLANAPSVASAESDAFVTLCAHLNYQQTAANPQIGSPSQ